MKLRSLARLAMSVASASALPAWLRPVRLRCLWRLIDRAADCQKWMRGLDGHEPQARRAVQQQEQEPKTNRSTPHARQPTACATGCNRPYSFPKGSQSSGGQRARPAHPAPPRASDKRGVSGER
jgi:hypothetical protein